MFNSKSLYALNKKNPDAIVYPDANGEITYVTRDDFASEEEFLRFKAWSDENFHIEDNGDVVESKHTVSIHKLSEKAMAVSSYEAAMTRKEMKIEQRKMRIEMIVQVKKLLTTKQFERYWKHYALGVKEIDIAAEEGVSQPSVSESIHRAEKIISDFFAEHPIKRP